MPPKQSKSKYFKFFDFFGDKATCKTCGDVLKCTTGNTNGLKYHVTRKHDIDLTKNDEPPEKKSKIEVSNQSTMKMHFKPASKEPLEDLVAREAVNGASFSYIAKSNLIKKGLSALGFQDNIPNHHFAVSRLVDKSAENHRLKLSEKFKIQVQNGQRFCIITDEWTCSGKKRKYINVTLHIKGTYLVNHLRIILKCYVKSRTEHSVELSGFFCRLNFT